MTHLHKNQEVIYKPDPKCPILRVIKIDPLEKIITCIDDETRKLYICEETELEA